MWSAALLRRCCFESGVSGEVLWRLSAYPKMRDELDRLPPKMLSLRSGADATPVHLRIDDSKLDSRVGEVVESIQRATFIINADGRIGRIWPKVKVPGHAEEVLEHVQAGG